MKKLLFTLLLAAVTLPGWAGDFYIVGNATSDGWTNNARTDAYKMTKDASLNKYTWTGFLKSTTDGNLFKICLDNTTWEAWCASSSDKEITISIGETESFTDSGILKNAHDGNGWNTNDNKWKVNVTGYYELTLDLTDDNNKTLTAKLLVPADDKDNCLISTSTHLKNFASLVNDKGMTSLNAELTADITLNGSHTPIGTSSKKYSGKFDGKEHKIINLSITGTGNAKGFFGETSGATIKDVEFLKANINITSGQNTGVVVGVCDNTTIQRCAVVNSIIKAHDHAGSIAGKGMGGSTITKCYSNATIQSDYQAGGMVGTSNGMTIDHCLFMGASIKTTNDTAGGLIARLEAGSTTLQYNFIASQHIFSQNGTRESECKTLARESNGTLDTKQHNYSLKATRYGNPTSNDVYNYSTHDDKNGAQKQPSEINETFFNSTLGFDFTNDWKMVSGLTYAGGSFPILKWMTAPTSSVEISSKEELYDFSAFMWDNQNVTLGSDITTDADYTPMGNEVLRYKGTFDGDGHSVTLAISKSGVPYQGLFGGAAGGAHFKNLIIKGSVTGGSSSAALVGEVGGEGYGGTITINRVGCEATVSGAYSYHGAFVGNNWGGTVKLEVEDCYNIGDVTGSSNTCVMGGYANNNSTFKNVFNKGTITGGGQYFVYHNLGKFDNCYTTSAETAEITGLTDEISSAMISSGELCYKLGHGTTSAEIWKQTIGTDNYPKLYGSTGVVNEVVADESYTNFATTDINSATHAVKIGTPDQLVKFSKEVNAGNKAMNAELTAGIDMSETDFTPIGTETYKYKGTFDGGGNSITLSINNTDANVSHRALIGYATGGITIQNLILKGSVTSTGSKTAGFIAEAKDGGTVTITNCGNEATISGGGGETAAIIANNYGSSCKLSMNNVYNIGNVSGSGDVSTICAYQGNYDTQFTNVYNSGNPTDKDGSLESHFVRGAINQNAGNPTSIGTYTRCYSTTLNQNTQHDNSNVTNIQKIDNTDVTSGKLCFLLNGETSGGTNWYQTLAGTDNHPYPYDTHKQVYQVSEISYSNIPASDGKVQISNANDLVTFSAEVNAGNTALNAVLTEDIDMNGVTYTPIGSSDNKYAGEFDGSGYSITLGIDNGVYENQGLFGQATDGTNIHDLIVKGSVKGKKHVAGVLGSANAGHIQMTNVINAANINATADEEFPDAAGLVGTVNGSTYITLTRCGNAGNVTGKSNCAALCAWSNNSGSNKSSYTDCWNIGTIGSIDSNAQLYRNSGNEVVTASGCYDASTTTNRGQGNLLSANAGTSGELCYKLNGNQNNIIWYQTIGTDTYPILSNTHKQVYQVSESAYTNLTVVEGKVQINNADELQAFSAEVNAGNATSNAVVTANIDMSGVNDYTPIGASENSKKFKGTIDGQNHYIKFNINNDSGTRLGLIGFATAGAYVKNLIIKGSIKGKEYIGGFVGSLSKTDQNGTLTFENCGNEANITATNINAGGLLGCSFNGEVQVVMKNCYNSGTIKGNQSGQLTAWSTNTKIENCYTIGDSDSCYPFARLDGSKTITNCYCDKNLSWTNHPTYVTSEQIASGELCYLLKGTQETNAFTQAIGTDAYPIFGSATVDRGQWFGNDYIYYNIDESGNITVNELNLDDTKTTYNVPAKVTAKSVTLTRTLHALTADGTASRWNTFCSPVAIAKSNFSAIKKLTGVTKTGNNYTMTFGDEDVEGDYIVAGRPYMVQVASTTDKLEATGDIAVAAAGTSTSSETFNGLTFTGNFTKINAPQNSFIISNNVFYNVDSDVTLKAFRGYITTASGTNVKALTFDFDDDATGIEETLSNSPLKGENIFNLAGQRIQKMQKGINIVNGKKILF